MQERALAFDFSAIMLNETLDDPMSTNVPTAWRAFLESGECMVDLFQLFSVDLPDKQELMQKIKTKTCQCLALLANVRHSLF